MPVCQPGQLSKMLRAAAEVDGEAEAKPTEPTLAQRLAAKGELSAQGDTLQRGRMGENVVYVKGLLE